MTDKSFSTSTAQTAYRDRLVNALDGRSRRKCSKPGGGNVRDFNFSEITVLHSPQRQFRLRVHKHARKSLRKLMISCTTFRQSGLVAGGMDTHCQITNIGEEQSNRCQRNSHGRRVSHCQSSATLADEFDSKAAVEKQVVAPLTHRNLLPSCLSDQTAMCGCRLQSGPGTKSRGDKCEKCHSTFHSGLGAI